MRRTFYLLVLTLGVSSVFATELKLRGRLLLQDANFGWNENTPAPHSKLKTGYTIGIAMFDDGSVAEKQFVFAQNNREKDGALGGYSLYTFPDGDSLMLEFETKWDESGLKFNYLSIIEGTGKFESVTGTGTGIGVAGPWYETIMADVILELKLNSP